MTNCCRIDGRIETKSMIAAEILYEHWWISSNQESYCILLHERWHRDYRQPVRHHICTPINSKSGTCGGAPDRGESISWRHPKLRKKTMGNARNKSNLAISLQGIHWAIKQKGSNISDQYKVDNAKTEKSGPHEGSQGVNQKNISMRQKNIPATRGIQMSSINREL